MWLWYDKTLNKVKFLEGFKDSKNEINTPNIYWEIQGQRIPERIRFYRFRGEPVRISQWDLLEPSLKDMSTGVFIDCMGSPFRVVVSVQIDSNAVAFAGHNITLRVALILPTQVRVRISVFSPQVIFPATVFVPVSRTYYFLIMIYNYQDLESGRWPTACQKHIFFCVE